MLGQLVPVSPSERKILLASGAAAGMAATFGAPLAAVVLAVELLIFEFSTRALIPLMISASIAAGMHSLFFGSGPLFSVPAHHFAGLSQLPFYALLGLACGALAVVINKGLFAIEDGFRRLPVSQFWWPAIGALGFASVGLIVPRSLGVGYDQIGDVLNGRLAVGALAVLLLAKLIAWWVALASDVGRDTRADPAHQRVLRRAARSSRAVRSGRPRVGRRVRARRDGGDLRRRDARDVHVDRVPLRAHA